MTRTAPSTFMGIPVKGDLEISEKREPQRPDSEFYQAFKALIDDPLIHDFGWQQYTPYFNDGDPCEFGVSSTWVRTIEDVKGVGRNDDVDDVDEDFDYYDFEPGFCHPTLGTRDWVDGKWVDRKKDERFTATAERVHAFQSAVESGGHFDLLYNTFGDHKQIRAGRDKLIILDYSHD